MEKPHISYYPKFSTNNSSASKSAPIDSRLPAPNQAEKWCHLIEWKSTVIKYSYNDHPHGEIILPTSILRLGSGNKWNIIHTRMHARACRPTLGVFKFMALIVCPTTVSHIARTALFTGC